MRCQKRFIVDGVLQNCRNDGREVYASRQLFCRTGTQVLAAGSSQLSIDLNSPHIITGCKCEIANQPDLSLHVETPGKSTQQTRAHSEFLAQSIQELMLSYFDLAQLQILPGRRAWKVYVDVVVLDSRGGNLLEHIAIGVLLALRDTQIPSVRGFYNPNSKEVNLDVTGGYFQLQTSPLPLIVTVGLIGGQMVLDMTSEEEFCAEGSMFISVSAQGEICGVLTASPGEFRIDRLAQCLCLAKLAVGQLMGGEQTFSYSVEFS